MNFSARFAIYAAVGIVSFSVGLLLTTALKSRTDTKAEKSSAHASFPADAETKPISSMTDDRLTKRIEVPGL